MRSAGSKPVTNETNLLAWQWSGYSVNRRDRVNADPARPATRARMDVPVGQLPDARQNFQPVPPTSQ